MRQKSKNNIRSCLQQQDDEQDCKAFRKWLFSLTRQELLTSMTVDFSNTACCHEYALLVEMCSLEAPPPTPIHPRAYGFRPIASRQFGLPTTSQERHKLLQQQPKLFQFSKRESYNPQEDFNSPNISFRSSALPRINQKNRGGERSQQQPLRQSKRYYDMIARKKITPWGQVLSLGTTIEQRDADKFIVQGSYIRKNPNNRSETSLIFQHGEDKIASSATIIIRILQVASRGYFLTRSGKSTDFCSPWLQPTERWFSLSFYLASRYHVSLWNQFLLHRQNNQSSRRTPPPRYESKILEVAIPAAIQRGFKQLLNDDQSKKGDIGKYLRDTVLWHAIIDDSTSIIDEKSCNNYDYNDWNRIWDSLIRIPLRQISNDHYMKLKLHTLTSLQHTLAVEMEKSILLSVEEDNDIVAQQDKQQPKSSSPFATTTSKSSKSNNKKKKKRRKNKQRHGSFEPPQPPEVKEKKEEEDKEPRPENGLKSDASDDDTERIRNRSSVAASSSKPTTMITEEIKPSSPPSQRHAILSGGDKEIAALANSTETSLFDDAAADVVIVKKTKEKRRKDTNNNKKTVFTVPGPKGLNRRHKNALDNSRPRPGTAAEESQAKLTNHDRKLPTGRSNSSSGNTDEGRNHWARHQNQHQHLASSTRDYRMFPMPEECTRQSEGMYNHPTAPPFGVDWSTSFAVSDNNVFQPSAFFTTVDDASANNERGGLHQTSAGMYYKGDGSCISNNPFVTDGREDGGSLSEDHQVSPLLDGWSFLSRYQTRDQSILTDFFETQEDDRIDEDEKLMAASTAASISSSTYKDAVAAVDDDAVHDIGKDTDDQGNNDDPTVPPVAIVRQMNETATLVRAEKGVEGVVARSDRHEHGDTHQKKEKRGGVKMDLSMENLSSNSLSEDITMFDSDEGVDDDEDCLCSSDDTAATAPSCVSLNKCRSPSPQAPLTPPPTLSPILLSLEDLKKLKYASLSRENSLPKLSKSKSEQTNRSSPPMTTPGSLPNSPIIPPHKNGGLTASWSREDLRITSFHDDSAIKTRRPQVRPSNNCTSDQQTYRAAAVKSLARPIASSKGANFNFRNQWSESPPFRGRESCAQSETALDERHGEEHQWQNEVTATIRRQQQQHSTSSPQDDMDIKSTIKNDETTTITSALSNREQEDHGSVRDERNSYRDMCLTLGAEVAKLKAMLATQRAAFFVAPVDFQDGAMHNHSVYYPGPFDPNGMSSFMGGIHRGQFSIAAMSDAGVHRSGDYESQVSEDEVHSEVFSKPPRIDSVRRMSSSVLGSDASMDNNDSTGQGITLGTMPVYDSVAAHGLQSRLTKDILAFSNATSMQLRKQDARRRVTVERFSRLVNTIWPRAQVKLYGSHVSGLCLPSSDLDFVICLPAVHKNAPALAPGVLEGRNAINETSQKLLARELKGESWVDPRSIKLIERTVVPVIKVSTKDTRARMLQLDISFDSPEHHGLHANQMVAQILEELPLIRPLMLVMKQFLLDRGLLTAYTGGLSSYCLFLMIARYLQEQSPACLDCGSLLMGFLDFHGNHFDPRVTGISVYRRQYFARQKYEVASYEATEQQQQQQQQRIWFPVQNQRHTAVSNSQLQQGPQDFRRRNSFSDTGSMDGKRRSNPSNQKPPRFQPASRFNPAAAAAATTRAVENGDNINGRSMDHGRPFTFDPLFVEDPLSAGNNVGRNAFRIFQVQRAFSDAHRALVASLEWDIHSSGDLNDADYPLLKCLLHSEDVFYES